jgi:hypothetical protein
VRSAPLGQEPELELVEIQIEVQSRWVPFLEKGGRPYRRWGKEAVRQTPSNVSTSLSTWQIGVPCLPPLFLRRPCSGNPCSKKTDWKAVGGGDCDQAIFRTGIKGSSSIPENTEQRALYRNLATVLPCLPVLCGAYIDEVLASIEKK